MAGTPQRLFLTTLLLALAAVVHTQTLVAELDYGTFEGAYSSVYNISYWQKIPFAAPPTNQNRFRAPQPPLDYTGNGTYNSSQTFDMCPQRTVNGSEDCLYLGLYSRPWTSGQPLRPVVVVFYGGAFIQGSASFTLPPSAYPMLNVSAAGSDLVFVYPNYRVNAFGFLAGREVAADPHSDTNAGLLDQRAAIKWVNTHAQAFGGDPGNVSIWGQSAGAGSVVAQVIGNQSHPGYGAGATVQKALASSPFWPKTYGAAAPEAQWNYDTLAARANCSAAADSLACLKAADVQVLRAASLYVAGSHTYNTSSYTWAPVVDGGFLPRPLSAATADKKINVAHAWGMYNTREGENFVPTGLASAASNGTPPFNSSTASFDAWLAGFLPGLSADERALVADRHYPPVGTTETSAWNGSYTRAAFVYRDVVLACPAYWLAGAVAPARGYVGEYSISPAKHGSDTYWWNTVSSAQVADRLHYDGYTGAFASFLATGEPDAWKLTPANVSGVPALGTTGDEFVIEADGFAEVRLRELVERCDFWRGVAPRIPI